MTIACNTNVLVLVSSDQYTIVTIEDSVLVLIHYHYKLLSLLVIKDSDSASTNTFVLHEFVTLAVVTITQ